MSTNNTTDPKPCRNGCGFFGSNATGDCCSKCYKEMMHSAESSVSSPTAQHSPTPPSAETPPSFDVAFPSGINDTSLATSVVVTTPPPPPKVDEVKVEQATPMDIEIEPIASDLEAVPPPTPILTPPPAEKVEMKVDSKLESLSSPVTDSSDSPAPKPKKKKKKMGYKAMMAAMQKGSEKDIDSEKEKMKSSLGGGEFTKIDKI